MNSLLSFPQYWLMALISVVLLIGEDRNLHSEELIEFSDQPGEVPLSEDAYDLMAIIQTAFEQNLEIFQRFEDTLIAYGINLQAWGRFDTHLSSSYAQERHAYPLVDCNVRPKFDGHEKRITRNLNCILEKEFLTGIKVKNTLNINTVQDNLQCPYYQNFGSTFLSIDIPFLRGSGIENVGAEVIATRLKYNASLFDFRFQLSRILSAIASSYWDYQYDLARIDALKYSVKGQTEFMKNLEILIEAGEVANTEIHEVRADLASKTSLLFNAEQELYKKKLLLLVFMNIDPRSEVEIVASPLRLPTEQEARMISGNVEEEWIDIALLNRGDYYSAQLNERAAAALVKRAVNDMNPRLDIELGVGSDGLEVEHRYGASMSSRVKGPAVRGAVIFETPFCYSLERGILTQRRAEQMEAIATVYQLRNEIMADVKTLASAMRYHVQQQQQLIKAVMEQKEALRDELFKFEQGLSTVFTIVQKDDRVLTTMLQEIEEERNFTLDLIALRFRMGLVIPLDECYIHLEDSDFLEMPLLQARGKS